MNSYKSRPIWFLIISVAVHLAFFAFISQAPYQNPPPIEAKLSHVKIVRFAPQKSTISKSRAKNKGASVGKPEKSLGRKLRYSDLLQLPLPSTYKRDSTEGDKSFLYVNFPDPGGILSIEFNNSLKFAYRFNDDKHGPPTINKKYSLGPCWGSDITPICFSDPLLYRTYDGYIQESVYDREVVNHRFLLDRENSYLKFITLPKQVNDPLHLQFEVRYCEDDRENLQGICPRKGRFFFRGEYRFARAKDGYDRWSGMKPQPDN